MRIIAHGKTSMGSCSCGDIEAMLVETNRGLVAITEGMESWQRYVGPASECRVSYGMGNCVRRFAKWHAQHGRADKGMRMLFPGEEFPKKFGSQSTTLIEV